jgi:hypothetical protein
MDKSNSIHKKMTFTFDDLRVFIMFNHNKVILYIRKAMGTYKLNKYIDIRQS